MPDGGARGVEFTYSLIDRMFRLSLGELTDFSGAKYDGDFSLSLEEASGGSTSSSPSASESDPVGGCLTLAAAGALAQFRPRKRRRAGAGDTLLRADEVLLPHGLDVHLVDGRELGRDSFGRFDAVASLGAFEHLLAGGLPRWTPGRDLPECLPGRRASFRTGGRLYLQTMVFGRNMIPIDEVSIDATPDSDAWYLALMPHQFPGSFLPFGFQQVVGSAEPYFRLVESSSGRLDYIETIKQWRARFGNRSIRKTDEDAARPPLPHQPRVPTGVHLRRERLAYASSASCSTMSGSCSVADEELLDRERAPRSRADSACATGAVALRPAEELPGGDAIL